MNCDEAQELLGAYALEALPPDEAAAMRAHLATCADHAAQAAELRTAAGSLAILPDRAEAPLALRARVLDAVAATPQDAAYAAPAPVATAPRARLQWAPSRTAWGAMAAAIIVLVGGLVAWNLVLMNRVNDSDADRFASAAPVIRALDARGVDGTGMIVYFGDEQRAVVMIDGMDVLDSSETYQMWTLGPDGTPTSAGLLTADAAGRASTVMAVDASAIDAFAVTIEPAGGSAAPTTDPIFVVEI